MTRIGIDPGHGGSDPGAVAADGLQEKDVTLAVGLDLRQRLQGAGLEVIMSRTVDQDVSLASRAELFNREQVDVVVSLHVNSADNTTANYVSTFILAPGGQAEKIARSIQPELVAATGWPDGGVREANFYILRETDAPAVLVEMGFISNPATASLLAKPGTRQALALAIFKGLAAYLGLQVKAPGDIQGHWAEEAIRQVLAAGIMAGYPDGTFRPDQPATRAELAAALARLLAKIPGTPPVKN
ncbi:N-acetylmuramoyl-L-alanine amidase [Neomoorella thermoacetica]|uniref:N-acetylmuramoyl-L-alanine amidase n=1 Tax=Neomoorella thermoacetica TaxID=1525 RepID=UPI0008FBBBEA|nr:N-acetylmuramoyl-L-alanine amidase [Moorella thermoacetica]APC08439.1 sporulation-specific N-acetylmuramoyl-L-alanine amidase [Moorella thermoacetica]OIQ56415.1 sporulation-specific N-acetylmuramoyl-L-alanine amidase [Moorella thermoacetica]